jgi:hypothetical protein
VVVFRPLDYVFFRWLLINRSVYLVPLHNIGKTTLETYLLQHHLWLSSNAKSVPLLQPVQFLSDGLGAGRVNLSSLAFNFT